MDKESVFKLKLGEVYKPVVEDFSRYEESIFKSTYDKALLLVKEISDHALGSKESKDSKSKNYSNEAYNNIIAFIGERGTGKTSAMNSFSNLLETKEFLENTKFCTDKIKFYPMGMIDPSQFEKQVNIIELILAKMFKEFKAKAEGRDMESIARHKLIGLFDKVYDNLKCLKNSHKDLYDGDALEGLVQMSASMEIKENIKNLVTEYLDLVLSSSDTRENSILVIQIDDIDLNTTHAYDMVEQLRKYLTVPRVIILMALKMDQLHDVVNQAHYKSIETLSKIEKIEPKVVEMTEKYLSKLIPIDHRLVLPEVSHFTENCKFIIEDPITGDIQFYPSLDHGVRELIYVKTGLHFINVERGDNYIVPQNLRELANFIQFLRGFENVKKSSTEMLEKCLMDIVQLNLDELKETLEKSSLTLKEFSWFLDCPKVEDPLKIGSEEDLDWLPLYNANRKMLEKCQVFKSFNSMTLYEKIRRTLDEMDTFHKEKESIKQKQLESFKKYFLTYWCSNKLSKDGVELINRFLDRSTRTKNKFLVNELQRIYQIKEILEKEIDKISTKHNDFNSLSNYSLDLKEKMISLQKVIYINNQSENISVGDVLFVLSILKNINYTEEVQALIFAIKVIYMIEIMELNYQSALKCVNEKDGIFRDVDTLIGGEYFSVDQRSLLPRESQLRFISRDFRVLKWSDFIKGTESMTESEKSYTLFFMNLMIKRAADKAIYRTQEDLYYSLKEHFLRKKDNFEFSILSPLFNSSLSSCLCDVEFPLEMVYEEKIWNIQLFEYLCLKMKHVQNKTSASLLEYWYEFYDKLSEQMRFFDGISYFSVYNMNFEIVFRRANLNQLSINLNEEDDKIEKTFALASNTKNENYFSKVINYMKNNLSSGDSSYLINYWKKLYKELKKNANDSEEITIKTWNQLITQMEFFKFSRNRRNIETKYQLIEILKMLNEDSGRNYESLIWQKEIEFFEKEQEAREKYIQKIIDEGENFYNQDDYENSFRCFEKVIILQPDSYIGWANAGVSLARQNVDIYSLEALKMYRKAIELCDNKEDKAVLLSNSAEQYNHKKDYDEAIKLAEEAIKLDEQHTPAYIILVKALENKGTENDLEQALVYCKNSLEIIEYIEDRLTKEEILTKEELLKAKERCEEKLDNLRKEKTASTTDTE